MVRAIVKMTGTAEGRGTLEVDGVDLTRTVTSVHAHIAAGEAPKVVVTFVAPTLDALDLTGASLEVGEVVMPPSVEMALHKYLSEKHVTGLLDTSTIGASVRSHSPDV